MPADDFSFVPTITSKGGSETKVLTANFGDGYNQRVADGLNSVGTTYELEWILNTTDAATMKSLFESKGGYDYILWTPNRGVTQYKWLCTKWDWDYAGPELERLTATFKRCFDL